MEKSGWFGRDATDAVVDIRRIRGTAALFHDKKSFFPVAEVGNFMDVGMHLTLNDRTGYSESEVEKPLYILKSVRHAEHDAYDLISNSFFSFCNLWKEGF
ncbi:MAG: hypothetical protein ACP5UV_00515 [Thermoplasmata archaeon]